MRFAVPSSDSDIDSSSDSNSSSKQIDGFNNSINQINQSITKKINNLKSNLISSSNSSKFIPLNSNQSNKKFIQSHSKKNQKSNGPYCVGLPVPTSETTPSPFALSRAKSKSTSFGFSRPKSTLKIQLDDEFVSLSEVSQEDLNTDHDEIDSEEEQWPISRLKSTQSNNLSARIDQNLPSHILPDDDMVQVWEAKERQSTYQLSMRNALARRKHFEGIHARTLEKANETNQRQYKQKMDELSEILGRIGLDKEKEMRMVAESFEKREKERSRLFESLILEAEKVEQEEILRQARIKQQEAARKAELERQEAIKKKELDERAKQAAELARLQEQKLKEHLENQKKEQERKNQEKERKKKEEELLNRLDDLKIVKETYEKFHQTMQHVKSTVLPNVSLNDAYRAFCRQAKRKITPKVGQLTNSSRQIEKVILELGDVLKETRKSSKDVYLWSCNHLSKALIKQAETEITAKLSTAYPMARLVLGLILVGYQELGDILMARLVKKCYFVTAYRPVMSTGQSMAEYRKQLGFQPESQEESGVQYSARMAGILALYAAIAQTDPRDVVPSLKDRVADDQIQRIPPQLRLDFSWCWFSYMLKLPMIQLSSTPQLISTYIEIAGARMYEIYGKQYLKLLSVILNEGIKNQKAQFNWNECKPSISRLETLLEDLVSQNNHQEKLVDGRYYENKTKF
ncbi:hypothetical protein O181_101008 [Austropuccinia psidii MF-1]|uniref:mRNA export factor GLE1 n=1 Tax=Austropuccinia psidii MF-1 TaxID=1389203 RepID=A0A9Q3JDN8_9BASI|nr:hypothetical protein [Austropuccinia psidii MF-1]